MYIIYGLVLIASGIFVASYGNVLFRFALAALGFGIGAILAWWLTASQPDTLRILISVGIGGITGVVLYMLVRIGIYIAGGILGLVLAFLVASLFGINNDIVNAVILIGGAGVAGFFGPRLGSNLIAIATGSAGAFQIVYGLALIFGEQVAPGAQPTELLVRPLALAVFLVIAVISVLAQTRRRVVAISPGR